MSIDKRAKNVINTSLLPNPGPYLARIVNNVDPMKQGSLEVELLRPIGNQKEAGQQLFVVRYLSPFYGCTGIDVAGTDPVDFNDTQKSYGFWAVPPDVGVTVMVIFVDSDPGQGFWMGCVQDALMNYMIPGIAASNYTQDQVRVSDDIQWGSVENTKDRYQTTFLPVGEVNRKVFQAGGDKAPSPNPDVEANKKPIHPIAERLLQQGTLNDPYRGVYTSSARRESPSNVYGWSTPGPVDKRKNAIKGKIGRREGKINKFVSRMGGHCIIMDDGDDRFLRKTRPWEGEPEYADIEKGEQGLVDFPKDEAFRIRTRKGAQILMHCSEDFIYICNSRGTAWIELTSKGKIELYAQEGVHMSSGADIQMTATRHIAQQANGNYVTNVVGNTVNSTGGDHSVAVSGSSFHRTDNDHSINSGNYLYTEGGAGHHLKGENLSFSGTAYEWTIAGSLMMTVQGNLEIRATNTLISSDFQTHMASGSDTRINARELHTLTGGDTTMNATGNFNLATSNMLTVNAASAISMKSGGDFGIQAAGGSLGLKSSGVTALDSGGALSVNASGNITVDSGSEIHMQMGESDQLEDMYDQPYPAKPAIEADQASGAAGNQTAGGGHSTAKECPTFPAQGWGACVNKLPPTPEPHQHENLDPEASHVRYMNMDDPRSIRTLTGKRYTIKTPYDLENVPSSDGGYGGGQGATSYRHSRHDQPNLGNSYTAAPLDSNYSVTYPPNWTQDKEFISKAQQVASKYGCTLEEFLTVLSFETAHTMSPSIPNPSKTRFGLIQMGKAEAASVGTNLGALRAMSRAQQLEYVDKYLSTRGHGQPKGIEEVYLSVMAPAYIKVQEGREIYKRGTPEYRDNPGWREGGPHSNGPITRKGVRDMLAIQKKRIERELGSAGINTGTGPSYPQQGGAGTRGISPSPAPQSGIPSGSVLNRINPADPSGPLLPPGGTNPK